MELVSLIHRLVKEYTPIFLSKTRGIDLRNQVITFRLSFAYINQMAELSLKRIKLL